MSEKPSNKNKEGVPITVGKNGVPVIISFKL